MLVLRSVKAVLFTTILLWLAFGCAATVEMDVHKARMAEQQAAYEERLRAVEHAHRKVGARAEEIEARAEEDRKVAAERIEQLESTLADKQRLLDDVSSQLVELQGAFSKLSSSQRKKIQAKTRKERQTEAALLRLKKRFSELLSAAVQEERVTLAPKDEALVITFEDGALFSRGSARLSKQAKALVEQVATGLKAERELSIEIDVHTDNVRPKRGAFGDTWAITGQQGLVLVRALQKHGVDPSRLSYRSRGQFKPRASNDTKAGRGENRRIELSLRL